MKSIILIRHAKSDWGNFRIHDAERPLNDRGRMNAPVMAKRLAERFPSIDLLISSPAVRAATTAQYFAAGLHIDPEAIQYENDLYLPAPEVFIDVIKAVPDSMQQICIFSHNAGITQFANMLSNATIDNMPTCSIFAVNLDLNHWNDFLPGNAEFAFFDYPKRPAQS